MIEENGKLSLSDANDANVPVNIFINDVDDNGKKDGKWHLWADNFMPRKGYAESSAYSITADTREELAEQLTKYVLPLYQIAINQVNGMIAGTKTRLYYWEEEK